MLRELAEALEGLTAEEPDSCGLKTCIGAIIPR